MRITQLGNLARFGLFIVPGAGTHGDDINEEYDDGFSHRKRRRSAYEPRIPGIEFADLVEFEWSPRDPWLERIKRCPMLGLTPTRNVSSDVSSICTLFKHIMTVIETWVHSVTMCIPICVGTMFQPETLAVVYPFVMCPPFRIQPSFHVNVRECTLNRLLTMYVDKGPNL